MRLTPFERKYAGKGFVFHSPFKFHPGWEEGEVGVIIRRLTTRRGDCVDEGVKDMWAAWNQKRCECYIYGGEAFDPITGKPLIPEHRFTSWKPS